LNSAVASIRSSIVYDIDYSTTNIVTQSSTSPLNVEGITQPDSTTSTKSMQDPVVQEGTTTRTGSPMSYGGGGGY